MPRPMTPWNAVLSVCLLALAASSAHAQDAVIRWRPNYNTARAESELKNLPLLLDFWNHGCHPCIRMDQVTFTDPRIIKLINERFIPVKINLSADTSLATKLNIEYVPTCILLAPDGKPVNRRVGFQDGNAMHEFLQQTLANLTPCPLQEKYSFALKMKTAGEYTRAVSLLRDIIEDGKSPVVTKNARELLTIIENHAEERLNIAKEMHNRGNHADALDLYANVWRTFPDLAAGRDARDRRNQLLAAIEKQADDRLSIAKEMHAKGPVADSFELYADVWRTYPKLAAGRDARDRLNLLAQRNQKARALMKQDFIPCIVENEALWGLWPYGPVQKSEPVGVLLITDDFVPRPLPTAELKVFDYERTEGMQQTKALLATYNLKERYAAALRAHAAGEYTRAVAHLRFIRAEGTSPAASANAQDLLTVIEQQANDRLNVAKEKHAKGRVADAVDLYAEVWRTFPTLPAGGDARDRLNVLAQRNQKARDVLKLDFIPCVVRHDTTWGLWPYGPALKSEPLGMLQPKGEFAPKQQPPLIAMKVFDFDRVGKPTTTRIAKTNTATALVAPSTDVTNRNGKPTSNPTTPAAPRADVKQWPTTPIAADPSIYYMVPTYAPQRTPVYGPQSLSVPAYAPSFNWTPQPFELQYYR